MRLDGRGAIVTGAANGLGLSIARTLSQEGARVALADLDGYPGARSEGVGPGAGDVLVL